MKTVLRKYEYRGSKILAQKQETPYKNNLFSNHFLEERLQNLEEWKQAEIDEEFDKIQELWDKKKQYLQNQPNEDNTQDEWINEILKIIGHNQWGNEPTKTIGNGRNLNPDYLFFKDFETKLDSEESDNQFEKGYLIGEAKKWNRTLDKSMDNHENPSFQIFNYVDRLRTPWGLLTNGKKWRLYSYEDCEADTFYEINIVETILKEKDEEKALQNFKYFYLFFRQESFLPGQNSFVDQVYEGSESYAKDLEDDLEDNIYTALEETARGFFETNDIEKTEENIEKVHRSSLILLYRFLFILNAESRELLPVDEKKYRLKLSLEYLKKQLKDENDDVFSEDTWAWDRRIRPLFEAINEGEQYGDFKITAYNGGLFDEEKHPFLAQHELQGNHLKRILELLAQSTDEETGDKVLVDYRDLNIRHLGSVYEGLLEHELRKAEEDLVLENGEWESANDSKKGLEELPREKKVEEGKVYLTNESGERKATGSYYTPEYIVEYIVENTVGPKVEEKIEESDPEELLDNVRDLNICDPAMGSGHFLTEATSFIARRVLEHGKIQDKEVEGENEFVWVKRQVVSHCIYGVDINPLAVELGKLSLWIETMAEGRPLSFLDHHLKVGNSLIGSDFDDIFSHPTEKQKRVDSERWQFVGSPEDLKEQFQEDYQKIEDMDEETKEKVHKKEEEYQEFKNSTLYTQIRQLANIHTRQYFEEEANSSDYEDFIVNIGMEDNAMKTMDWFKSAQKDADERNYFHWEIEFPKVFFGEKQGFDAVVGNPPYVIFKTLNDDIRDFYREKFDSFVMKGDIYTLFMELSTNITQESGLEGFIIQNKFTKANYGEEIREKILEKEKILEIIDFHDSPVFEVTTYPMILIRQKLSVDDNEFLWRDIKADNPSEIEDKLFNDKKGWEINQKNLDSDLWSVFTSGNSISAQTFELGNIAEQIGRGAAPGNTDVFLVDESEIEEHDLEEKYIMNVLRGGDVKSYTTKESDQLSNLIYPYNIVDGEPEVADEEELPNIIEYLSKHRDTLEERKNYGKKLIEQGYEWYELTYESPGMLNEKIVFPDISPENRFALDSKGEKACLDTIYYLVRNNKRSEYEDKYFLSILNSKFLNYVFGSMTPKVRGGYRRYKSQYVEKLPIPESPKEIRLQLVELVDEITELKIERNRINLKLEDYLGNYGEGDTLDDLYTPASGVSDTPLTDTASDREKLQVGSVDTQRNGDSVTLLASTRYKPEDESGHDTDQYGYTETELFSAMEFHDLSETEKALIEEFVPVAVDEAGGFADFRKKATKTMSLIDRLKKLTLPKVSDVEDDLQKFIEQRNKAEELEEKIEKTDQEINEIVYDLYDLTEEEIEIVEESVES